MRADPEGGKLVPETRAMQVQHPLLILPIHRRSFDRYYADHDRHVEHQVPEVERDWGRSFDQLPTHIRIHWKDRWYWPPWFFNDVVGFLKLGMTGEDELAGDIFLKRRHFPLTAPERLYRSRERTRDREQVLYFWSLPRRAVDPRDNRSYLEAVQGILAEARTTVRKFGRGTRGAEVWRPPFDLACFDFAAAARQARQRAPEEERTAAAEAAVPES